MIRTGLDALLEDPSQLAGRRYGLLAHAASVDSERLEPIQLALRRAGADDVAVLFGPEHGYHGVEQDMVALGDATDPWTGVPLVSLYGSDSESLRPQGAVFKEHELDLLVIDLQDVGARYYTYAATAAWAASAALEAGLEVWVLDRPNPLGGMIVEGGARREGYESFVGAFDTPVRHGLTLGELVQLEASRAGWSHRARVFPLEGWSREMTWKDCGRSWVPPSPNLPSLGGLFLYPGGCLIEATEVSEGRGTTTPFELIGAPGLDALNLTDALAPHAGESVAVVPTYFRPGFQKHAGEVCGGVRLVVTQPNTLDSYRFGVRLVEAVHRILGDDFAWREKPYEFVDDTPAIDLLTGDDRCRKAIEGGVGLDEWIESWAADEQAFREERREALIYPEVGK